MPVGAAGWSIPAAVAAAVPGPGSHLERYARRFACVEINSSFHRPHRRSTYERWAASVPPGFRFAVKVPKSITHQQKLADCGALIERFADEVSGLGGQRGPLLVQLPPSLAFDAEIARRFLDALNILPGPFVIEPRHPSWFAAESNALLVERRVARVAADPAVVPAAATPGGWRGLAYFRWHGSPQIYRSAYAAEVLADQAGRIVDADVETWTIFDNTASGAAMADALALQALLG